MDSYGTWYTTAEMWSIFPGNSAYDDGCGLPGFSSMYARPLAVAPRQCANMASETRRGSAPAPATMDVRRSAAYPSRSGAAATAGTAAQSVSPRPQHDGGSPSPP